MNTHDQAPLTPEERDLAQRLSRLGGHAAPSAALDAAILASARASVQAAVTRKPRTRWPMGVGIAASLVVAIGLAWQLRPQAETITLPSTAETPAETGEPAGAASEAPTAEVAEPSRQAVPADAAVGAGNTSVATATPDAERAVRRVADDVSPAQAQSPATIESEPLFDVAPPASMAIPAPPPAPPPPLPAPEPAAAPTAAMPTPVFVPEPETAEAAAMAQERKARAESNADAMRARNSRAQAKPALDAIVVTGTRVQRTQDAGQSADAFHDQPMDDQPPASFDTPEARDAWLLRIRELLRDGERDAARDSLREFTRRHPQHVLPEDLKALLQE